MPEANTPKIEVVTYEPNWPSQYDATASKILKALGINAIKTHHIGSTAVPFLAAKPKIDIIVEVNKLTFDHQPLIDLNYEYRGGFNLPLRKTFTYRSSNLNVNLHVFERGDPEVELNLLFRDYLRSHPQERDRYATLKYQLLKDKASHKRNSSMYYNYTLGKHDLIQDMLKKAGFSRLRFVICAHYIELDWAKNFRNKYFFGWNNIKDPYTWTFDHKDHKHFMLYQGVDIVGYAHIQLWPRQRAAIRIIIIDEKQREKGYGKEFITFIEKWLRLQGYKSVHVMSGPTTIGFYQQLGYISMPFNDPDGYKDSTKDMAMGKVL